MKEFYILNEYISGTERRSIYDKRYNLYADGWFIYKLGRPLEDGGYHPTRGIKLRIKRNL